MSAIDPRAEPGDRIDETGVLVREGASFLLQRDAGGRWRLDMHRVPVDLVGKRVRIIGFKTADDRIDVEGAQPG